MVPGNRALPGLEGSNENGAYSGGQVMLH